MTDSLNPAFVLKGAPLTEAIVAFAAMPAEAIPASARHVMRLSLLDWCAVAIAGKDEPVSRITREMIEAEAGAPVASLVGSARKVPARAAALVNGATSHALDYDDTHFDHIGHPSVAIVPAALAMAEMTGASGAAFLDAALIGVEASVRIGTWLGREHYQHGFHQTATAGAFGAAIAAGRLADLDDGAMAQALGIVATRASGLKSQFGTMGKPYHAGMAAANGVEAVLLAKTGFVSRPDGLECEQGFGPTHAGAALPLGPVLDGLGSEFRFERVQHKFHACCHGTHAMLEALAAVRGKIRSDDIETIAVTTHPRWLRVCHILAPATGLEAKFSYRLTAAMALSHVDTGALASFTDALCADPALASLRDRVAVETDETLPDTATRVRIRLRNGEGLEQAFDLDAPLPVEVREAKIRAKAASLLGAERAETFWKAIAGLDEGRAVGLGSMLAG